MSSTTTTSPPTIQRHRPTDATGWFWSFVLLLAGLFYSQIYPIVGILLLLASPCCFIWQFKKWKHDSAITQNATAWCRIHYPLYGDSPIVDFMVALAHDTDCDFTQLTPSTPLDDLVGLPKDDDQYSETDFSNHHQAWLAELVYDAKVQHIDPLMFSGRTLHDAVHFVATPVNID